jgi:hypothetical protein
MGQCILPIPKGRKMLQHVDENSDKKFKAQQTLTQVKIMNLGRLGLPRLP